jgi:hypothetical protein
VVRFAVTVEDGGRGRLLIPVPFDPDRTWSAKPRHHVGGTVNGCRVRGVIERHEQQWRLVVGAMWARDCGLTPGVKVNVDLEPEGPQRGDLAEDIATALAANPAAAEFFDALAQFYRRGYLRWIDGTKRNPDERARRIARTVELLAAGVKDYHEG